MPEQLTRCAIASRFAIIFIQFVANLLIPDHNASVFLSPTEKKTVKLSDLAITTCFGGLGRWDGQYFLHLAEHGYTYEQTLAFYPLYPFTVGWVTRLLTLVLPASYCSFRELSLAVATFINVIAFIQSVKVLHSLTRAIFNNKVYADLTSILFCINPASIFFSAVYTEPMFALLTFSVMNACHQRQSFWRIAVPLSLSVVCRSNGLINLGFVIFYGLHDILSGRSRHIFKSIIRTLLIFSTAVISFLLCQWYFYGLYCTKSHYQLPQHVIDYGQQNNLTMFGVGPQPTWCRQKIPFSYSYIQSHYWDVGFLKYYKLKQIPNFLLAMPILVTLFYHCVKYLWTNRVVTVRLNLFDVNTREVSKIPLATRNQFVFVAHALVLVTFCTFFVHIQVSTRMLCSSSPLLYWICAKHFHGLVVDGNLNLKLLLEKSRNVRVNCLILIYFCSYCVIGTVLFSNFLPWT